MSVFVCDPADQHWLTRLGIASADSLMSYHPSQVAAVSGSSETFEVTIDSAIAQTAPRRIFVKRYRYRSWAGLVRGCFRGTFMGKSRARLEFEALGEMRRRGVSAVRPIAFAENRRMRVLRDCALITEGEPNAQTLSAYFTRQSPGWDLQTKRRFISATGRSVARLHKAGVVHGGLFWRNVLVTQSDADEWVFTLLDPSRRCRFYADRIPKRARISDLSDFVASASDFHPTTDVARFLREYEEASGLVDSRKSLALAISKEAARKTAHEGRRIAVGATLAWLQQRMRGGAASSNRVPFDSLHAFFSTLEAADPRGVAHRRSVLRFEILGGRKAGEMKAYTVVVDHNRVSVTTSSCTDADLVIRTDTDALLAVVNAQDTAVEVIQSGRLELRGDPKPLALLAKLLDG